VSGRLLSDITRSLPAKPVDVSVEGTRVLLTCGSARFSLPTMAVEDYPTLPGLPEETGVIASDLFSEAIGQVALPQAAMTRCPCSPASASKSPARRWFWLPPIVRLAVRELTWSTDVADLEAAVLVPAKTLAEAAKAGTDGAEVHLSLGQAARSARKGCSESGATASAPPVGSSMRSSRSFASCCRPSTPRWPRSAWPN